jgi:hypothetical protein
MEARRGLALRPNGCPSPRKPETNRKGNRYPADALPQGRLSIRKVEPVKIFVESLLDFLSALEFRPRLRDNQDCARIALEKPRLLVSHHLLFFAGDRKCRGEGVQLRGPRLLPVAIFINSGTSARNALK